MQRQQTQLKKIVNQKIETVLNSAIDRDKTATAKQIQSKTLQLFALEYEKKFKKTFNIEQNYTVISSIGFIKKSIKPPLIEPTQGNDYIIEIEKSSHSTPQLKSQIQFEIVALTSGTKSLPYSIIRSLKQQKVSDQSSKREIQSGFTPDKQTSRKLLKDLHAEMLLIKAFRKWIVEIFSSTNSTLRDKYFKQKLSTTNLTTKQFRFKTQQYSIFLYSSQKFCGDCSILQEYNLYSGSKPLEYFDKELIEEKTEQNSQKHSKQQISHNNNKLIPSFIDLSSQINQNKPKTTIINQKYTKNILRTKPGRLDLPLNKKSLSLSCSDKLALYNILGIQGKDLFGLIGMIYVNYFIVGEMTTAVGNRDIISTEQKVKQGSENFQEAEGLHSSNFRFSLRDFPIKDSIDGEIVKNNKIKNNIEMGLDFVERLAELKYGKKIKKNRNKSKSTDIFTISPQQKKQQRKQKIIRKITGMKIDGQYRTITKQFRPTFKNSKYQNQSFDVIYLNKASSSLLPQISLTNKKNQKSQTSFQTQTQNHTNFLPQFQPSVKDCIPPKQPLNICLIKMYSSTHLINPHLSLVEWINGHTGLPQGGSLKQLFKDQNKSTKSNNSHQKNINNIKNSKQQRHHKAVVNVKISKFCRESLRNSLKEVSVVQPQKKYFVQKYNYEFYRQEKQLEYNFKYIAVKNNIRFLFGIWTDNFKELNKKIEREQSKRVPNLMNDQSEL